LWWADGVAGLLVTGFIVHVGWEVTSDVVSHLMDGVDPDVLAAAESSALTVPGVDHVHVRARWLGRSLLVEVEGFMAGQVLLTDTEATGSLVRDSILGAVPEVRAVVWAPHTLPAS
jgi:divalent metal cation (Fe/Co/Zn/Cd) transporter